MNQQDHDRPAEGKTLRGALRRTLVALFVCPLIILWPTGCASTRITEREVLVSGGMRVYAKASGQSTVAGRARATAKEISAELKKVFQEQGWIAR